MTIEGFHRGERRLADPEWEQPHEPLKKSPLYQRWANNVKWSDNDFIIVVTASTRSSVSGVGKTTAAINLAREFDQSPDGYESESKATMNSNRYVEEMLANPENVANKSAVIFDESQGTLKDTGADARRSMADSVVKISKAAVTMRKRQLTEVIVAQNTGWIDKRIDTIMDALVIIQPRDPGEEVRARVYTSFYNDLEQDGSRYTKRMCDLTWEPIPKHDPDYAYIDSMKDQSATHDQFDPEETQEVPRERKVEFAQEMRDAGLTVRKIADIVDMSHTWVVENTDNPEEDE